MRNCRGRAGAVAAASLGLLGPLGVALRAALALAALGLLGPLAAALALGRLLVAVLVDLLRRRLLARRPALGAGAGAVALRADVGVDAGARRVERRAALVRLPLHHRVDEACEQELHRAHGVVIARDREVDVGRIAVGVEDPD